MMKVVNFIKTTFIKNHFHQNHCRSVRGDQNLPVGQQRDPSVGSAHRSGGARQQLDRIPLVQDLQAAGETPTTDKCGNVTTTFHAVGECSDTLQNVGFTPPRWEDFAKGEPPPVESEDDRNIPRGWQKASTKMVEQAHFSAKIQPQLTESEAEESSLAPRQELLPSPFWRSAHSRE